MFTFAFDEHGWAWIFYKDYPVQYIQVSEVQNYLLWKSVVKPSDLLN